MITEETANVKEMAEELSVSTVSLNSILSGWRFTKFMVRRARPVRYKMNSEFWCALYDFLYNKRFKYGLPGKKISTKSKTFSIYTISKAHANANWHLKNENKEEIK